MINGHIRGVEIKAEADTLDRLPRQVAAYGEVVDKALDGLTLDSQRVLAIQELTAAEARSGPT